MINIYTIEAIVTSKLDDATIYEAIKRAIKEEIEKVDKNTSIVFRQLTVKYFCST